MWWPDQSIAGPRPRFGAAVVMAGMVVAALLLSGCGFQRIYADRPDGSGVLPELAAVHVDVIENREGQELRNELMDLLNPRGRPANPTHRLAVELDETVTDLAVRLTGVASRANLTVTADYQFFDNATNELIFDRQITKVAGYNLIENDYSTLIARNDTRRRLLARIAEDLRSVLALYFQEQQTAGRRVE